MTVHITLWTWLYLLGDDLSEMYPKNIQAVQPLAALGVPQRPGPQSLKTLGSAWPVII